MIIRSGVDIIDLKLIGSILDDPEKLKRMLLPNEIERQERQHIAGRISIKEAVMKAANLAGTKDAWHNIHISQIDSGRPIVSLSQPQEDLISLDISVAHHGDFVVATAVALYKDPQEVK